ncbi:uncharacterized protein DNG_00969 [Cephalotrichum gorgonifer]|uniref:C2 domain-containing protein n=1 Tax=Cephalotrichum gorgonifer TaxID=2041049 RepID=A0AAE8MRS6_9PEZI|nr:uncharacterized protein DNG_00969 [Cephalotrichum gorgonifer]
MSGRQKLGGSGVPPVGIFSDMTVDGPQIGTLVLVVDRAKNLPNRKSIGKQDPYCAARLGKEAKKTKTDVRGGQTPRWDQELRFDVHDSPDYYQLKLSVFHDDKKTDLIGESWIDLKDIVVPGGNQKDLWHNLSCRGKYAGEIRIELTYYDSRPKPAAKPKQVEAAAEPTPKARVPVVKRRPLPSGPVPGPAPAAAPAPAPAVDDLHPKEAVHPAAGAAPEPLRPQPKGPVAYVPTQSPLQAVEYGAPAPQRQQHQPDNYVPTSQPPPPTAPAYTAPLPVQHETPPRTLQRQPEQQYSPSPRQIEDRNYTPQFPAQHYDPHDTRSQYSSAPEHYQPQLPPIDDHGFQLPPDDERPPPPPVHRSRTNSSHELMARGVFDTTPQKGTPPPMRYDVLRNEAHRNSISGQTRPVYRSFDSGSNSPHHPGGDFYDAPSSRHNSYDAAYDPHDPQHRMQPTVEDEPDSPTQTRSRGYRTSDVHARMSYQPHGMAFDENPTPAPLNLSGRGSAASGQYSLPQPPSPQPSPLEENRYALTGSTVSSASGERQIAAYRPPPPPPAHRSNTMDHTGDFHPPTQPSPSMEHANGYQEHSPPLPGQSNGYREHSPSVSAASQGYAYRGHSPSVSATHSNSYRENSPSAAPSELSRGYSPNPPFEPSELGDTDMSTALVPRQAYHGSRHYSNTSELDETESSGPSTYTLPQVPPSLVPGVDPALAREVSERIYEERRQERRQRALSMATPPRGRGWSDAPGRDYNNGGGSPAPYTPPQQQQQQQGYGAGSMVSYGTPTGAARAISKSPHVSPIPSPRHSPNPNHTIKRKSVSPAPPPSETRASSSVPFGPDSYDSLNPAFSASQSDATKPDPNAKIITYDGREVDPSDHLPMESWAPEPEPKDKNQQGSGDGERGRGYSSPRGAQPPSAGRRQLRIAGRPQSMAGPVSSYNPEDPRTPPGSAARNRLQKKSNRMSALPSSGSPGGSPLAPISPHSYNADASGFTPPRPSRASTWDYPSENHAPQYGSSPGGSMRGGPPHPPKIPIPVMSGALVATGGQGGGPEDWALMEEMSRIDIGAGRSRRHGGY